MYNIRVKKSAQKELLAIPSVYKDKIVGAIDGLASNPRPDGVKKLQSTEDLWRIRVGDYRIIYSIDDSIRILEVQKIGHRKDFINVNR